MKKAINIILILLFFYISALYGQDKKVNFGVKAGVNYGTYIRNKTSIDYHFKVGFYAGGFSDIAISERARLQPELLFALQGSRVKVKGLNVPAFDYQGYPLPGSSYDFEYEINELTLLVPISMKIYVSKKFFLESGPQFGFIVDRNLKSSQHLLAGQNDSFIIRKGDSFDFGLLFGLGRKVSDKLVVNFRTYTGIIKRDDNISSYVLNLGVEYNL